MRQPLVCGFLELLGEVRDGNHKNANREPQSGPGQRQATKVGRHLDDRDWGRADIQ